MKKITTTLALTLIGASLFAQTYTNAESVEYDTVNNQWLVSNGSRMIADDGSGNLTFFGNGTAQAGSEIIDNTIFVNVGGSVIGYDLATEAEVMNISIPGASFLNGMATDGVNTIYPTGFNTDKIYAIDVSDLGNPTFTEIVSNTQQQPNGIIFDGDNNRLLYATWTNPARIKAVDLATNTVSDILTTGVGNIDGIDRDSQGNYYVSSWGPNRITKYNSDFTTNEVITVPGISNPADISINLATDRLAVPIFSDVLFVDLEVLSATDFSSEILEFRLSSNPINQEAYAQFTSSISEEISLKLYNIQGKLIKKLFNETANGTHKVLFAGLQLESGIYFLELKTASGFTKTIKILVD